MSLTRLKRERFGADGPYIARYVIIGALVFVIDVASFQALLREHAMLAVAATGSFGASLCTHFSLNRLWNFRNFERSGLAQFRTYMFVVAIQYAISLASIEIAVTLGAAPIIAKVASVLLNFPVGFIGHRYLTFGSGLSAALRQIIKRAAEPQPPS